MKMIHINFRVPKEELERIQLVLTLQESTGYKNRSELIRDAVRLLLNDLLESD